MDTVRDTRRRWTDGDGVTDSEKLDHLVDNSRLHRVGFDEVPDDDDEERAGFILFALLALAFPALVALGFIWSSNPIDDENADRRDDGLESVELTEFPESTAPTESASADSAQGESAQLDGGTDEGGAIAGSEEAEAPADASDAVPNTRQATGATNSTTSDPSSSNGASDIAAPSLSQTDRNAGDSDVSATNTNGGAAGVSTDDVGGAAGVSTDGVGPAVAAADDGDDQVDSPEPPFDATPGTPVRPATTDDDTDDEDVEVEVAGVVETAPPTTTREQVVVAAPTTTRPPTTTTTTTITEPPIQLSPTVAPTTTTTTTTTTRAPVVVEPPEFSQRIDIGRIGDTTLAMRFQTTADANYTLIVRSGGTVATQVEGFAQGGQLENVTIDGLTPGTDYTVEAILDTSPPAVSPAVPFRTSGGTPEPAVEAVTLINPRVVDVQSTRFEINYESNICANGSFVIRDPAGTIVGSNAGQAAGCTTRHLAIPGFWTPALRPNTTYTITLTVEANGAGQGGGNTASTSVTVTTSG